MAGSSMSRGFFTVFMHIIFLLSGLNGLFLFSQAHACGGAGRLSIEGGHECG